MLGKGPTGTWVDYLQTPGPILRRATSWEVIGESKEAKQGKGWDGSGETIVH